MAIARCRAPPRRADIGRWEPPSRMTPGARHAPASSVPSLPTTRCSSAGSGGSWPGGGPIARRDDARDRRSGRHAGRADGPAQGLRRRRLPLLHQLRVAQGRAARGRAAGGADSLLARGRPPGADPWPGRAAPRWPNPMPTSPPGRALHSSARGRRRRAGRFATGRSSTPCSRRWRTASARARYPVLPHWGGYVVRHDEVEFWQGQVGRLHDRFLYTRDGDVWRIERLGP